MPLSNCESCGRFAKRQCWSCGVPLCQSCHEDNPICAPCDVKWERAEAQREYEEGLAEEMEWRRWYEQQERLR